MRILNEKVGEFVTPNMVLSASSPDVKGLILEHRFKLPNVPFLIHRARLEFSATTTNEEVYPAQIIELPFLQLGIIERNEQGNAAIKSVETLFCTEIPQSGVILPTTMFRQDIIGREVSLSTFALDMMREVKARYDGILVAPEEPAIDLYAPVKLHIQYLTQW